jgi:hypothetical protein
MDLYFADQSSFMDVVLDILLTSRMSEFERRTFTGDLRIKDDA